MQAPGWLTNPEKAGTVWGMILGWVCVAIGIFGIVLPIIPGLPFLFAGLVILSARYKWASDCLRWAKRKASTVSALRSQRNDRSDSFRANRRQPVETGDQSH